MKSNKQFRLFTNGSPNYHGFGKNLHQLFTSGMVEFTISIAEFRDSYLWE